MYSDGAPRFIASNRSWRNSFGAWNSSAPKEFRQDLLDAMKRGAPTEYKEQLKRYYEELAK